MLRTKLILPSLALALAGGAFAQGDDCGTALAIGTTGTFAFDTTLNTTSIFDGGGSCVGGDNVEFDAFYQWTAPAAGDYILDTETSTFDTQLSAHTGIGCAATCVAHDDDAGTGLLSRISLPGVLAGDTFLIQVGGYPGNQGVGALNINVDPCTAGVDDALEENDDCASATAVSDGTYAGLFVSGADKDHYSTCVADGATLDVDILFLTGSGDCDLMLWDAADINCGSGFGTTELASGFSISDNETISWTNTTGANLDVVLEVNVWVGSASQCNNYDLVVAGSGCGPGVVGVPFCDPATLNSTGAPAVLAGSFGTGVGSDLHLEATDGPPTQIGYFLAGNEATAGISVSNGLLCLVGTGTSNLYRYNVSGGASNSIGIFDAAGVLQNVVSTSLVGSGFDVPATIPDSPPITIMAGDTWHFQCWFRDTAAMVGSSNFTNGLSVTF